MTGSAADDRLVESLLSTAIDVARAAGDLALRGRRSLPSTPPSSTKSSDTDEVTEFDRAVERLIVERLSSARPRDAVVGEEGAAVDGTSGYVWFIDPIDGTTNFVYDLPSWCTSIAVSREGVTLAGAVYAPVTAELYAARVGGGSTLNGRPIRCSGRDRLELALVATGFGYDPARRQVQAARVAKMMSAIRDVRRLGSAAIDLCHVAAGRVDAYFEEYLNPWDAAAGELIVREAGGTSSDFAGSAPRPEELVVATPRIHGPLLELIARAGADPHA